MSRAFTSFLPFPLIFASIDWILSENKISFNSLRIPFTTDWLHDLPFIFTTWSCSQFTSRPVACCSTSHSKKQIYLCKCNRTKNVRINTFCIRLGTKKMPHIILVKAAVSIPKHVRVKNSTKSLHVLRVKTYWRNISFWRNQIFAPDFFWFRFKQPDSHVYLARLTALQRENGDFGHAQ